MPFTKFVEVGRIAYIAFGPHAGKICAIVDVIDQNRALVDGPCSGVPRQSCSFKRLHLTKFRIKFQHSSGTRVVRKAWEDEKISEKWAETSWAKRLEDKKLKAKLTDFDRFKLMKARQSRNRAIRMEYNKLKRKAKKLQEKPKPKVAKPKPVKPKKKEPPVAAKKAAKAPKKTEGKPKAGGKAQKGEGKQKPEGKGQKSEGKPQKSEGKTQKSEGKAKK